MIDVVTHVPPGIVGAWICPSEISLTPALGHGIVSVVEIDTVVAGPTGAGGAGVAAGGAGAAGAGGCCGELGADGGGGAAGATDTGEAGGAAGA